MKSVGKVINGKFEAFGTTLGEDFANTPITFEQAAQLANVQSGDSMSVALGKLSKLYAELESGQLGNAFSGEIAGNRALISDENGKIMSSDITSTELNALDGISGNVQEKLTELTGNMVLKITKNYPDHYFTDFNTAIESLFNWVYETYGSGKYFINCNINSNYFGLIQVHSDSYGSVMLLSYESGAGTPRYSQLVSGTWKHSKMMLTSDLGYVECEVNTAANDSVIIQNSPNTSYYIPVIIWHASSNTAKEYVFWNGSNWSIFCDYTQLVSVRFYKYPV